MKKKYHIDGEGRKWYFRLVDKDEENKNTIPLMKDYSISEISDKMLICQFLDSRLFTLFESYFQFVSILNKFQPENRCFYEVVLGNFLQKPHFDIDISRDNVVDFDNLNKNLIMNQVVEAIIKTLREKNIEINIDKDVLLFSSHSINKISFHIVIDNYCHSNNIEAKQFYKKVIEKLPSEFSKYVDSAVYSKVQQFRIVGCQKYKSGRPKTFIPEWEYFGKTIKYEFAEPPENEKHRFNMLLGASLLSNASYCNLLPSFYEEKDQIPIDREYGEITSKEVSRVMDLIWSFDPRTKSTYQFLDVVGGIITLKRLKPSRCGICQRIHEAENPYVMVIDGNVYFDCRRAGGKKLYLGKIEMEKPPSPKYSPKSTTITNDWIQQKITQLAAQPTKPVKEPDSLKISKMTPQQSFSITSTFMTPDLMSGW